MKKLLLLFLMTSNMFVPSTLGSSTLASPQKPKSKPTIKQKTKVGKTVPVYLTMEEAVQRALIHRPDLEALEYTTQAYKSGAKAEIAGYFPQVTLESSMIQNKHEGNPSNTTSLSANQLIYSFAGPKQKYKRAKKYVELSELEQHVQKNKIRLEVEKAFIQAWLAQEENNLVTSTLSSAQKTFQKASHENKLQLLDKNVWLQSAEKYASDLSLYYQFYDNVQIAFRRLEYLIGQPLILSTKKEVTSSHSTTEKPTFANLKWEYPQKKVLAPLNTFINHALKHRPEIKQGAKLAEIQGETIKLTQGSRLPTISASAQTGHNQLSPSGKGFHSIGVSLSWSLFDGTVSYHQEQQAHANKIKELLGKEQTVLNIKQDVNEKYLTLSKALTQHNAQKISYLRSHNEFKLRREELTIGQISPVEFESAKKSWEQAQFNWISSNATISLVKRDLLFVCGYPAELSKQIKIN